MSGLNFNSFEVQEQIHRVIKEIKEWNNIPQKREPITQITEEYYHNRLTNKTILHITLDTFFSHIERAQAQPDCEVTTEEGCYLKVIREKEGYPKKFIVRYFDDENLLEPPKPIEE